MNEQLLDLILRPNDHAPGNIIGKDDEQGGQPSTAKASSVLAVGGAQSLLQPEDPKEDVFRPVVDPTPTPRASASSFPRSVVSVSLTVDTLMTALEIGRLEKGNTREEDAATTGDEADGMAEASKVVVENVSNSWISQRGFCSHSCAIAIHGRRSRGGNR